MQRFRPGHKFSAKERTADVWTEEQVDFESLLLSPLILKGLTDSGFDKPSPIQLKAIPLGRCGLDLIAQAKSGTGKTCVFSVIALENVLLENPATQVLILAPTREIAVQIKDVVNAIGCHMKGLSCQVFIGGLPLDDDKKALKGCQIAVGSPGRIKNLIDNKHLKTDSIRMFILDEADKLLDENFQEQINWIFSTLPDNKQMMAFSATYPEYLANHLTRYMREPTFVRLSAADPTLQGIKQFYHVVPFYQLPHKIFQEKVEHLLKLLSKVNFHQCLLFSNFQIRAQSLSSTLCTKGWPATFIAGSQTQEKRLQAMEKLKAFKCRILISTDLTARGIDAENVNLVVNMDVPRDGETYLHRIGRAGRFGTKGVAVTFVAKGKEEEKFREIEKSIGITMEAIPDHIPDSLMISDSLPGASQIQVKQDTVEVSVLHKSTTTTMDKEDPSRSLTSNGERNVSNGLKEAENHHKQKKVEVSATFDYRDISVDENWHLSPEIASHKSNGSILLSHKNETVEKDAEGSNKQAIKAGFENGVSVKQGKPAGLPSLEEFEKDFEEYLAMTSTFENIDMQDKGGSCHVNQTAVVMGNLLDRGNSNQAKETYAFSNMNNNRYDGFVDGKLMADVTRKQDETVHTSKHTVGIDDNVGDDDKDEDSDIRIDKDDDDDDDNVGDDDKDEDSDIRIDKDKDDDDDNTSSANEDESDKDSDSGDDDDDDDDDGVDDGGGDDKDEDSDIRIDKDKDDDDNTSSTNEDESDKDSDSGDDDDESEDYTRDDNDKKLQELKDEFNFSNVIFKTCKKDKNYNDTEIFDIERHSENDQQPSGDDDDDETDEDAADDSDENGGDSDNEDTNNSAGSHDGDNEAFYGKQGHEASQGIESTHTAQYHDKSSIPEYQWNGKYPDNHGNSMGYYSGISPWQHGTYMHDRARLMTNQATFEESGMSGVFSRSTTQEHCSSHLGRQHYLMNGIEHQPSAVGEGCTCMLDQNREASWSKAWHNAYYQINNAIQQFAAMNSRTY